MFPRVAYVTGRSGLPDTDLPLALAALRDVRLDAEAVSWDDDTIDWGDYDLVIVRSAWDYVTRRPEFLRWARRVEDVTRLANPARCLVINTDKTYLRDLALQGVPTIPTVWFEPGDDPAQCLAAIDARSWQRCVVKPSVAGGGPRVRATVVPDAAAASSAASELATQGLVALIQPYLAVVEQGEELGVVVLGGRISHAVTSQTPLQADTPAVEPAAITPDVQDLVAKVLGASLHGEALLYARIDLVPHEGGWLVMEVEATEPRLFLDADPAAPGNFAHAVRAYLHQ